ncbi:MAG: hypothetical protein ACTHNW_12515 [Mucilaginibacter sp.]
MLKPIKYPYSKATSYLYTLCPLAIVTFSVSHLIHFIQVKDFTSSTLIIVFDGIFILMMLFVAIRFALPATLGKIALEFTSEGIVDYKRNVIISWDDIEDIDLRSSQTQSSLYITFNYVTDHGTHIRVPLGYVKGDDESIYTRAKEYCREFKK